MTKRTPAQISADQHAETLKVTSATKQETASMMRLLDLSADDVELVSGGSKKMCLFVIEVFGREDRDYATVYMDGRIVSP
jgi:hypothetical protein